LQCVIFQLENKKIQKINKLKFYYYYFFKYIYIYMGVWDSVMSQPRPDLLDTPPVTVRLQCRDDRFYSTARRISIRNHQLADLGQV
jgi:hypothetical protein